MVQPTGVAARAGTREIAERVAREVESLYTNGPAGGGGAHAPEVAPRGVARLEAPRAARGGGADLVGDRAAAGTVAVQVVPGVGRETATALDGGLRHRRAERGELVEGGIGVHEPHRVDGADLNGERARGAALQTELAVPVDRAVEPVACVGKSVSDALNHRRERRGAIVVRPELPVLGDDE